MLSLLCQPTLGISSLTYANSLPTSTLFFVLSILATSAYANETDTASICPPGQAIVITHPGDETIIRCQADYTAPIIAPAVHHAPLAVVYPVRHSHRRPASSRLPWPISLFVH